MKVRTGGSTRREKVRFDTEKRSPADVGKRNVKEENVKGSVIEESKKRRASKDGDEKAVKGKAGGKKYGGSSGRDKGQRTGKISSTDLEQGRDEGGSSATFMTQSEGNYL